MNYFKFILTVITFFLFDLKAQVKVGSSIFGTYNSSYGNEIAISNDGKIIATSGYFGDGDSLFSGYVKVYELVNNDWKLLGNELKGNKTSSYFGYSIDLTEDGKTIIVSAPHGDGANSKGIVNVYELKNKIWQQVGNTIIGDSNYVSSGRSVKISGDGKFIAIGSPEFNVINENKGRVKIFKLVNNVWTQYGQDINGLIKNGNLGFKIDLSDSGNIVAISSSETDPKVRVYKIVDNIWKPYGNIIEDTVLSESFFGVDISLSSNGDFIAIGNSLYNVNFQQQGAVRIFNIRDNQWHQVGNTIRGSSTYEAFGYSISLSKDAKRVLIGSPFYYGEGYARGKAVLYEINNNNWNIKGRELVGEYDNEQFGFVSLSGDGNYAIIGAIGTTLNDSTIGKVEVYRYNDNSKLNYINKDGHVSIFPTPTISEINLLNSMNTEYQLIDLSNSKIILTGKILTNKERIDLSNINSGIYYLKINNQIHKIIKL